MKLTLKDPCPECGGSLHEPAQQHDLVCRVCETVFRVMDHSGEIIATYPPPAEPEPES